MSINRPTSENEFGNLRQHKRDWVGYAAVVIMEAALTVGLLLLMPYFPIGRYPISYILVTMISAYLFTPAPAILSIFLGWFLFTYFFVPPAGISWPLGHSLDSWAQQMALLLGVIVVGTGMIQVRRSNLRVQRLADESMGLNVSLQEANKQLASINEELAATNEELRATTEDLHEEIAERKRVEEALRESEERVRRKLDSILSPEGDLENLELADIIDAVPIQSLMESFYEFAHIPMAIIDLKGKVLVGVGWQDICTKFHRINPETCKHCIESDTQLSREVPQGEFKLYKCKNGMWDVATPIMVGGEHVGNLFSGQFFFDDEPINYDLFRSQARLYGFDEDEYIAALDDVHRLSRETLDEGMSFFMKLADLLSKLSYSNIRLARSLSERDTLMDSLRESREDLNRAQAVAHTGSWRLDVRRNELVWSDEVYRMFGLPIGAPLTYESFLDAIHPDDREYVDREWNAALAGEPYDIEHRIIIDGTVKWVRERAELEFDQKGDLLGGFGTVQDITRLKQTEEEIRKLNVELEQRVEERTAELEDANKELEAFSYSVSHDLRAPLRAIDGFSNTLLKRYRESLDEQGQSYLDRVAAAAKRMTHLIDDILELSRAGRVEMHRQQLDVDAIAFEVIRELQESQPDRHVEVSVQEGLKANADSHLLRIILDNLLGNAWKYSGKREIPRIEVGSYQQNGERVYFVKDNGAGFNPDYADKLFAPFQRLHTENEFAGTGIGLALVQRIIRRHGGRIWAESQVDKGAEFYFTLGKDNI